MNLQKGLLSVKRDLQGGVADLLLTPKEIDKALNKLEDALGDSPVQVLEHQEDIQKMVGSVLKLSPNSQVKLLGMLSNGMRKLINLIEVCLRSNDLSEQVDLKSSLEVYAYFVYGAALFVENPVATGDAVLLSGGSKKSKSSIEWDHIKLQLAESTKSLFGIAFSRVFESRTDAEAVISCLIKTLHLFLERPECLKINGLRMNILESMALAVKDHQYSQSLRTIILQDLNYFDHLAEFSADLLNHIAVKYDDQTLLEDVLKDLSAVQLGSNETAAAKIIAEFLEHLSLINPKLTLRQLSSIVPQLDSESHTLRMSVIQVIGNVIRHLATSEERTDQTNTQLKSLFQVIEERFHDVNSFVRARLLNVLAELCRNHALPINRRARLLSMAVDRVMDKSSTVRKKAVQLLGELLRAHPFGVDGGELDLAFFQSKLTAIDGMLAELSVDPMLNSASMSSILTSPASPSTTNQPSTTDTTSAADPNQINSLLMQKKYYTDAVKFVQQLEKVIPILLQLLTSTVKTEVFEVMDFFVDAHTYKLRAAECGVRKMVHLVWEKDLSGEDGVKRSVKDHLVECYRRIYLDADERLSPKDRILATANSLLEMVNNLNLAELTSIDELVQVFVKRRLITEPVIQTLYSIITAKTVPPAQQRSAIILFAMLSKADHQIVEKRLDGVVRVGLGRLGQRDPLVAQYTCQAIQSIAFVQCEAEVFKLPNDNVLFSMLTDFVTANCFGPQWMQTLTEAINAIYLLADKPDIICADLLRHITDDVVKTDGRPWSTAGLSKLLFLAGQIALQHNLHLDSIERHWKRHNGKFANGDKNNGDLAQTTGTAEDDFADMMRQVKEHELLYGDTSVLRVFGPMAACVALNNLAFPDECLQRVACLCLGKMMSVSARFCEEHLSLFLTIMERSPDPIIRSNMAIAFGDICQSFSRLLDPHIGHLFHLLRPTPTTTDDSQLLVRRTALMVITHLTLSGMIKVKGAMIGDIAMCVDDSEEAHIRDLARMFFAELAGKDASHSVIYNHLPDIITAVTLACQGDQDDGGRLARILRFIFAFIKKDRQLESLVEKLCLRFRQTDVAAQRATAACLLVLPINTDKCVGKVVEGLPYYQDKLCDAEIAKIFTEIAGKIKKLPSLREDTREMVMVWEGKMSSAMDHTLGKSVVEEDENNGNEVQASQRSTRYRQRRQMSAQVDF